MHTNIQLTINSFRRDFFPDNSLTFSKIRHFPDICQISWHFKVFQTSDHPEHCTFIRDGYCTKASAMTSHCVVIWKFQQSISNFIMNTHTPHDGIARACITSRGKNHFNFRSSKKLYSSSHNASEWTVWHAKAACTTPKEKERKTDGATKM